MIRHLSAALASVSLLTACEGDSPSEPQPLPADTFAVTLDLAVLEGGTDYFYGEADWVLLNETFDTVASASFLLDTIVELRLAEGAYALAWQDVLWYAIGSRFLLEPVTSLHEFVVASDTTLSLATAYLATTATLRVDAEGYPADGRVRWALYDLDGTCVRCFHPLSPGEPQIVDLIPQGTYELWWMSGEWHVDGPYIYYFSPTDSLQQITLTGDVDFVDASMQYQQVSGSIHFYVRGLPEPATVCLCMTMREPVDGGKAITGSLAADVDGEVLNGVDPGRWVQTWLDVEIDGVTYVPAVDSTSIVVQTVTEPAIVEVTYAPQPATSRLSRPSSSP